MAAAIDREVRRFVEDAYERAKEIYRNTGIAQDVVNALLEHETLDREHFRDLMGDEYRHRLIESQRRYRSLRSSPSVAAVRTEEQESSRRSEAAFDGKQPKPAVNKLG